MNLIFIHSLWRSGSTYLFSVFRRSDRDYWCYQEPLNEIAYYSKDTPENLSTDAMVSPEILRHPILDKPYFQELFDIWPLWREDIHKNIIFDSYFDEANNERTITYLNKIIRHSKGRPVIQECRTSNRIKTLKNALGGIHIFLWRNPWDQWWSYKAANYFDVTSQLILNAIDHPEIINRIKQEINFSDFHHEDLSQEFQHFYQTPLSAHNSYYVFYLIWCLGLIEGTSHSQLMINIDTLSDSTQYQIDTCEALSSLGVDGINFSDCSVYQNNFTDKEIEFFRPLEDRVHGLLLICGYTQQTINTLLHLRKSHEPKSRLSPHSVFDRDKILTDAERARNIVLRYESLYSELLINNTKRWESCYRELQTSQLQFEESRAREEILAQKIDKKSQQLDETIGTIAINEKEFTERLIREKNELLRSFAIKEQSTQEFFLHREDEYHQNINNLMNKLVAREREFGIQSLLARESFENEKSELMNRHFEKEQQLKQDLQQQFKDTLSNIQHHQNEIRLQSNTMEQNLKQQIQEEQQNAKDLKLVIALLHGEIAKIRSSFSWWITAPLRKLVTLFNPASSLSSTDNTDSFTKSSEHVTRPAESPEKSIETPPIQIQLESEHMYTTNIKVKNVPIKNADELLSYNNKQFIIHAYQILLGRDPDTEGMNYYLNRLRAGFGKTSVLVQLAKSREAKNSGSDLAGLRKLIASETKITHRFFNFLFSKNKLQQHINRLEYQIDEVLLRQDQIVQSLSSLTHNLTELVKTPEKRQASQQDGVKVTRFNSINSQSNRTTDLKSPLEIVSPFLASEDK